MTFLLKRPQVFLKWGRNVSFSAVKFDACDPVIKNNELVISMKEEELEERPDSIMVPDCDSNPEKHILNVSPEHMFEDRRVFIRKATKNPMQSGTNNVGHWKATFDTIERWENPLMGWTASGDPFSSIEMQFECIEDAIKYCDDNGWQWFTDCRYLKRKFKPKSYSELFSWNRRTRASTK